MRVILRVLAVAALILALLPSVAGAQGNPLDEFQNGDVDGGVDQNEPGEFEGTIRFASDRRSIGETDSPCEWLVYDYYSYQLWWYAFPGNPGGPNFQEEGDPDPDGNFEFPWVIVWCTGADGFLNWLDGYQLGDPPADPEVLAEDARRNLFIPLPVASFNPDPALAAPQVVGLETWVWVDPADTADQTATACIPDPPPDGIPLFACVTITARFVDTGFDMGDGSTEFYCGGPGIPYDSSQSFEAQADADNCGHVFLEADAEGTTYNATATTFWRVTWECTYNANPPAGAWAGCGGGDFGVIGRSQVPTPLEVLDLQARAIDP